MNIVYTIKVVGLDPEGGDTLYIKGVYREYLKNGVTITGKIFNPTQFENAYATIKAKLIQQLEYINENT